MAYVRIEYGVHLESGLHVGTGLGIGGILDGLTVQDRDGLPIIPGSSIKGRLRWQCARLLRPLGLLPEEPDRHDERERDACRQDPCPVCRVFGSARQPGGLAFRDAWLGDLDAAVTTWGAEADRPPGPQGYLTMMQAGVQIDRKWRTAADKHLYSHQRTEANLDFRGEIEGRMRVRDLGEHYEQWAALPPEVGLLVAGMLLTRSLGGGGTKGWGAASMEPLWVTVGGTTIEGVYAKSAVTDAEYWEQVGGTYAAVLTDT